MKTALLVALALASVISTGGASARAEERMELRLRVAERLERGWVLEDLETGARYRVERVRPAQRGVSRELRFRKGGTIRATLQQEPASPPARQEPGRVAPSVLPSGVPGVQDDRAFYYG